MMPHEEEWEIDANVPDSAPVIGLRNGGVLFECSDMPHATLAHAAPNMARLLLDFLKNYEFGERVDSQIRAALVKAGVPIP